MRQRDRVTRRQPAEPLVAEEHRRLRGVRPVRQEVLAHVALAVEPHVVPEIDVLVRHLLRHEPLRILRQLPERRGARSARPGEQRPRLRQLRPREVQAVRRLECRLKGVGLQIVLPALVEARQLPEVALQLRAVPQADPVEPAAGRARGPVRIGEDLDRQPAQAPRAVERQQEFALLVRKGRAQRVPRAGVRLRSQRHARAGRGDQRQHHGVVVRAVHIVRAAHAQRRGRGVGRRTLPVVLHPGPALRDQQARGAALVNPPLRQAAQRLVKERLKDQLGRIDGGGLHGVPRKFSLLLPAGERRVAARVAPGRLHPSPFPVPLHRPG